MTRTTAKTRGCPGRGRVSPPLEARRLAEALAALAADPAARERLAARMSGKPAPAQKPSWGWGPGYPRRRKGGVT